MIAQGPGRRAAAIAAFAVLGACERLTVLPFPDDGGMTPPAIDASALGNAVACDRRDSGEPCGTDKYCRSGRCEANVCGDGLHNGGEECDDGNALANDGCDPSCRMEMVGCGDGRRSEREECDDGNLIDGDSCSNRCKINACGNRRVDAGEECDDGNRDERDDCSNLCTEIACRNGRLDPGEECDDGNAIDRDACTNACRLSLCGNGKLEKYESCDDGNQRNDDACPNNCVQSSCGNGVVEAGEACEHAIVTRPAGQVGDRRGCSADCKTWVEEDECERCADTHCKDYLGGVNLIEGCFQRVVPDYGADATDPTFIQDCIEVVNCALEHACYGDPVALASPCYCGSNSIDVCATDGPAADAPCAKEWFKAAKTATNKEVQERFTDLVYPAGWAYFLLGCYAGDNEATPCRAACLGDRGPR